MWNIQIFSELPSTQTFAREKFDAGTASHGDVFIADHQNEGRGQYHWRLWQDEPGSNLLLSLILTDVSRTIVDLIQFVAALSVLATIRSLAAEKIPTFNIQRARLKWPNDILLDGKKISGILSEVLWSGQTVKGIIIGVGINVNQITFPEPIVARATSLHAVFGQLTPLEKVRDVFLDNLSTYLDRYTDRNILLNDLRHELAWMCKLPSVSFTMPDGFTIAGARIVGISDAGALHISSRDGVEHTIQTATITFDE